MKELVYVYGPDCSRCHTLKPHVEKRCDEHKYTFKEMTYADSWFEVESIPTAQVVDEQGERILDIEWIVDLISNQK